MTRNFAADHHFECIVVGGGVEGSSTALELARRGKQTLLIEQFPLPHTRGSSHGASRITRRAYHEAEYTKMMAEGYRKWEQLEKETNVQLYRKTGLLVIGPDEGHLSTSQYIQALQRYGVPHEVFEGRKVGARFPGLTVPDDYGAVYDPDAGVLYADKCLRAIRDQFKVCGGILHDCEKVIEVRSDAKQAEVLTNKRAYTCNKLVLCIGPWAANFLNKKLQLNLPLEPKAIKVLYWKELVPGIYSASNGFPCIMFNERNKEDFHYSLPADEYEGYMKLALHYGKDTDPDDRDSASTDWVTEKCSKFAAKFLPYLKGTPGVIEACMYTMTPDENPILDRHPIWPNIVIGAGFSGHGFKLGPVVGGILADLAYYQKPPYDMRLFSIGRFGTNASASKL